MSMDEYFTMQQDIRNELVFQRENSEFELPNYIRDQFNKEIMRSDLLLFAMTGFTILDLKTL